MKSCGGSKSDRHDDKDVDALRLILGGYKDIKHFIKVTQRRLEDKKLEFNSIGSSYFGGTKVQTSKSCKSTQERYIEMMERITEKLTNEHEQLIERLDYITELFQVLPIDHLGRQILESIYIDDKSVVKCEQDFFLSRTQLYKYIAVGLDDMLDNVKIKKEVSEYRKERGI